MKPKFQLVALIGKYQTVASGVSSASSREALQAVAQHLHDLGCDVVLEQDTALNMGITGYPQLTVAQIG
ncbi:NAD(+)/NADH kinase family protein [mine drainage metagenome]|uniref:NAD(+)/NADH kinase family protein n=1 Tax=mine drainage metagenome TaxID=410659 RepID=A0A1J5PWH8_9ZZZZ